jgi:hypothetical protein
MLHIQLLRLLIPLSGIICCPLNSVANSPKIVPLLFLWWWWWWWHWFELRASHLTRQVLYHLSRSPALSCFSVFQIGSWVLLRMADLGPQSYLQLSAELESQVHTPHLAYWLRCGLVNFLPGLVSNQDPPVLCLPCSWEQA